MKIQESNKVKVNKTNRGALQNIAALFLLPGMQVKIGWIFILLVCGLYLGSPITTFAQTAPYVHDDAGLLTGAQAIEISNEIKTLTKETGWEVMAFSTDDTRGETSKGYGETAFGRYAVGEDGVAVIIDMDNGEVALVTFGVAADYLSDERLNKILDDSYGYAADEQYVSSFSTMIQGITTYYEEGKIASPNKETDTARTLSVAIFFVIVFMMGIFTMIRKRILKK